MLLMIKILEPFLTWFYLKLINYRGTSIIYEMPVHDLEIDGISVVSVRGYNVGFFCQEIRYKLTYSHSSYSKEFVVYKLYAKCDEESPEILKRVIADVVHLPAIVPVFVHQHVRRRIMLEAYVDILKQRMMKLHEDS